MELKEATFNNKSRNLKQKQNQSSADTELIIINLKIHFFFMPSIPASGYII